MDQSSVMCATFRVETLSGSPSPSAPGPGLVQSAGRVGTNPSNHFRPGFGDPEEPGFPPVSSVVVPDIPSDRSSIHDDPVPDARPSGLPEPGSNRFDQLFQSLPVIGQKIGQQIRIGVT